MIRIENIGKAFSGRWAVRSVSIEIQRGEVFGLLGPNGAGKTTLIRMLSGLIMPSEGRALIGGYDIVDEPLKAKALLGYVPDRPFLFEKLTGREFLVFMASIRGIKKEDALKKIEDLIVRLELPEYIDELIESYSQGIRQRLLFASALVHAPQALLIDEPFVGLDPIGVILIKEILLGLAKDKVAVLLATHSLHIAQDLCSHVGLINKGRLITIKERQEFKAEGLEELFLKEVAEK